MSLNSTPRTWSSGELFTADVLNTEIRDPLTGLQAAWDSYTPVWGAGTTPPVLGDGTLSAGYLRVGRTVWLSIALTTGPATTPGAGPYSVTLPFAAASSGPVVVGQAHLCGTHRWGGQTLITPGGSTIAAYFPTSTTDVRLSCWDPSTPEALEGGTGVHLTSVYQVA